MMAQSQTHFYCKSLIDRLTSSKWRLDRLFISLKDGSSIGIAFGTIIFSKLNESECYLQYYEHGQMEYSTVKSSSFAFKKHYLLHIESLDNARVAIKWYFDIINEPQSNKKYKANKIDTDSLFVDQNLFIGFEFEQNDIINSKIIKNIKPHKCAQDLYQGTMQFVNDNCFSLEYHVVGPSKMYNIQSTFTLLQ